MRRRGSVSFVVEVMRRRFPQNGATTGDLDRKSGSRISPLGAGGLSVTPLIERDRVSGPTIEAAKIAAKRFFSEPSSPQSARADHWSDPSARGLVPRVAPARPADVAVQKPAGEPGRIPSGTTGRTSGKATIRTHSAKSHRGRSTRRSASTKSRRTINPPPAAWPARAKRHPQRDQGRSPDRQPTDPRAQDARETQHGLYGIERFDGHPRARPQVARRNGRDRSQSRRRYATGQNSAAQEEEGDEGPKTSWQPASDRERKGRREATGTEAGGQQKLR